eukprot:5838525-Heterocapsa_arctica.AAC.1
MASSWASSSAALPWTGGCAAPRCTEPGRTARGAAAAQVGARRSRASAAASSPAPKRPDGPAPSRPAVGSVMAGTRPGRGWRTLGVPMRGDVDAWRHRPD